MSKQKIVIIGLGPACMMATYQLAKTNAFEIHCFEQTKRAGNKFLVAGNGGFNLTHGSSVSKMQEQYSGMPNWMLKHLKTFSNKNWIEFLEKELNVETFKGTSNRVFPKKGIKPGEIVKHWIEKLEQLNVHFHYNKKLINFSNETLTFEKEVIQFDYCIMGLGGISWSKTGSDGNWIKMFENNQICVQQYTPSNAGYKINWPLETERRPIKYVKVHSKSFEQLGDLMITPSGIEGTPIYSSNRAFKKGEQLFLDFKPNSTFEQLINKFENRKVRSINQFLKKDLKLDSFVLELIREGLDKESFSNAQKLIKLLKNYPLPIESLNDIEEAISSDGGILIEEILSSYSLKKFDKIKVIGEMLNWDAPTGGYLIQACITQGYIASKSIQDSL